MNRFGLIFALPKTDLMNREYIEESPGVPEAFPLNKDNNLDYLGREAWNEFCKNHPDDQYLVAMSIHNDSMPYGFEKIKLNLRRWQAAPPEPQKPFTIRPLDLR